MARVNVVLMIMLFAFLVSCRQQSVLFTEPQPPNAKELTTFPESLLGSYVYAAENLNLEVQIGVAYLWEDVILPVAKMELDTCSNCIIIGDSIFMEEDNFKARFKTVGDSVFVYYTDVDTFYLQQPNLVLKNVNSTYFFNELSNDSLWRVEKISLISQDSLEIATINRAQETAIIKELMPVQEIRDTAGEVQQIILSPSSKQFKALLNQNTFGDKLYFIRK